MHLAAEYGQKEVSVLLITNGADVNSKTQIGVTALHGAATQGYSKICKFLPHDWLKKEVNSLRGLKQEFGIVEYQSELTNKIIQKILKKGSCELPDIHWSIKCHKILINSMLNYWNQYNKVNIKKLPVT